MASDDELVRDWQGLQKLVFYQNCQLQVASVTTAAVGLPVLLSGCCYCCCWLRQLLLLGCLCFCCCCWAASFAAESMSLCVATLLSLRFELPLLCVATLSSLPCCRIMGPSLNICLHE